MSSLNSVEQMPDRFTIVRTVLAGVLVAWAAAVAVLAARGFFVGLPVPGMALFVLGGIVLPTIAYATIPRLRAYIDRLGLRPLTALHVWRMPAALAFFAYGAAGALPPTFWLLAGGGDLIAGLYAARALLPGADRAFYWRFHLFGFADFLVAVGTGIIYSVVLRDPRMEAIAVMPLALIPLFGVGISGASHLVAFHMLAQGKALGAP